MSLGKTLKKILITTQKSPVVSRIPVTVEVVAAGSTTPPPPPPTGPPPENPLNYFLPVTENPSNVINLISSSIQECNIKGEPFSLPRNLSNIVRYIDSNHVSQILSRFQSDPNSALSLFNWVKSDLMFDPSIENYCHIIIILAWSRKLTAAMILLEEMILLCRDSNSSTKEVGHGDLFVKFVQCREGFNLDAVVFDLLIKAHLKVGMIKDSYQLFHKTIDAGYAVSIISCNFLLDGLLKQNLISNCWKVFKIMRRMDIHPNTFTLNIMVNVLCKEGNMDAVFEFLEFMEEDGLEADLITYNTIISCFCRRKRLSEALNLFKIMSVRSVSPDSVTYAALLYGYCAEGRMKDARQLFLKMSEQGVSPNSLMYSTLVFGYCKEGKMVDAKSLIYEMLDGGIPQDDFMYRVMIEGYKKQGRLHKGLSVISELEKRGVSMPWGVYEHLIICLCDDGRVTAAHALLSRASSQFGYMPELRVYDKLIQMLCDKGMVVEALRLKVQLSGRKMKPSANVYKSLICCLSKMGKMPLVEWFIEEMVQFEMSPDMHTCRDIVNGHCALGHIDEALSTMELFAMEFRIHDDQSYIDLAKKICEQGDVHRFLAMQNRMSNVGYSPNRADCTLMLQSMWERREEKRREEQRKLSNQN